MWHIGDFALPKNAIHLSPDIAGRSSNVCGRKGVVVVLRKFFSGLFGENNPTEDWIEDTSRPLDVDFGTPSLGGIAIGEPIARFSWLGPPDTCEGVYSLSSKGLTLFSDPANEVCDACEVVFTRQDGSEPFQGMCLWRSKELDLSLDSTPELLLAQLGKPDADTLDKSNTVRTLSYDQTHFHFVGTEDGKRTLLRVTTQRRYEPSQVTRERVLKRHCNQCDRSFTEAIVKQSVGHYYRPGGGRQRGGRTGETIDCPNAIFTEIICPHCEQFFQQYVEFSWLSHRTVRRGQQLLLAGMLAFGASFVAYKMTASVLITGCSGVGTVVVLYLGFLRKHFICRW